MTQLVWVDAWEVQCCGQEFSARDEVSWPLTPVDHDDGYWQPLLGHEVAAALAMAYDGHADPPVAERRAIVTGIRTVSCRHAPLPPPADQRMLHVVAGSTRMEPVSAIDQWYEPGGDLGLCGWLVEVDLL